MRCPNCGWHVRGGARFCPNCGAEMPAEGPRTCPHCRAEIKGQVSLCPNCGEVLNDGAPEAAAEEQASAPATPPAAPEPAEASAEEKGSEARTCPNCKSVLKGRVGICPVCGEALSGPPRTPRRTRAAADDWPFAASAADAKGSLASKMKPLSPNWPFDEPETPKKKRSSKKSKPAGESKSATEAPAGESKRASESTPAGEAKATEPKPAREARAAEPKPAGEAKPAEPRPATEAKPAPAAPPKPPAKPPARERPASRGPAEPVRPSATPPATERPPEVRPWYVARPAAEARPGAAQPRAPQARPGAAQPQAPQARPTPPPRPKREAKPVSGSKWPTLWPTLSRRGLGLLPWFGLLVGLVFVSILVYGFAVGGLGLPHLGAASPAETPTPTEQPTQVPTQTPQPTATYTPQAPTATPEPVVHVVQPGESLLSIAQDYGIAADDLIAANGITESDVLRVGQELIIPGVVPTAEATTASAEAPTEAPTEAQTEPTAGPTEGVTATPAEGETPGAQPTPQVTATLALEFPAPNLLNPADGTVFGDEDILLNWSSVGLLADDTWYVVKIWTDDPTQPTPATGWTRTTAWRIPVSSRPAADAASHTFHWTVTVMRAVEGQEAVAVSPVSETRSFEWQ